MTTEINKITTYITTYAEIGDFRLILKYLNDISEIMQQVGWDNSRSEQQGEIEQSLTLIHKLVSEEEKHAKLSLLKKWNDIYKICDLTKEPVNANDE